MAVLCLLDATKGGRGSVIFLPTASGGGWNLACAELIVKLQRWIRHVERRGLTLLHNMSAFASLTLAVGRDEEVPGGILAFRGLCQNEAHFDQHQRCAA